MELWNLGLSELWNCRKGGIVELWNCGIGEDLWNDGIVELELWNCGIVEFGNYGIVEL